jgi:hypothetical protein
MLTVKELSTLLAERYDPDFLVEILDISSEDICERFEDVIESKMATLVKEFEEEQGEDEDGR